MRRTKLWNRVPTICGKSACTSLREVRRGIGSSIFFQAALRQWPGIEHDAAWQQNFSAMIEKARPHGWIDDQRNAIKAHIEWV